MVYGTMGGDGQPQTQACLISRYLYQGDSLEQSIAKPRWLFWMFTCDVVFCNGKKL
ncbi:gamma-glutamyltranspeptidase [Vibrio cholerae]|nr:gamma-glutamyltranspeptidase [Vibrio cholerae]